MPGLSLVFVWAVAATVFGIQKLKMLVCTHWKGSWTQKIPKWFWLVASIILPLVIVFLMTQRWAQNIVNPLLPDALKITATLSDILPLGLSATIGANGSYAVAKKWGLTGNYQAGGPNDVTPAEETPALGLSAPDVVAPDTSPAPAPVVSPEPSVPTAYPSARVFIEVQHNGGPDHFVLVEDDTGQHVYPMSTS